MGTFDILSAIANDPNVNASFRRAVSQVAPVEVSISGRRAYIIDGEKIWTSFEYPPIPVREFDWSAVTDDYDGAPDANCPVGHGATEQAALDDLLEQLAERRS